jgi:hypothetical protein
MSTSETEAEIQRKELELRAEELQVRRLEAENNKRMVEGLLALLQTKFQEKPASSTMV